MLLAFFSFGCIAKTGFPWRYIQYAQRVGRSVPERIGHAEVPLHCFTQWREMLAKMDPQMTFPGQRVRCHVIRFAWIWYSTASLASRMRRWSFAIGSHA
jgi:hypothetical protein